jgi:hypothetical protein
MPIDLALAGRAGVAIHEFEIGIADLYQALGIAGVAAAEAQGADVEVGAAAVARAVVVLAQAHIGEVGVQGDVGIEGDAGEIETVVAGITDAEQALPADVDNSVSDSARIWAEAFPAASRPSAASAVARKRMQERKNRLLMEIPTSLKAKKTARGNAAGRRRHNRD